MAVHGYPVPAAHHDHHPSARPARRMRPCRTHDSAHCAHGPAPRPSSVVPSFAMRASEPAPTQSINHGHDSASCYSVMQYSCTVDDCRDRVISDEGQRALADGADGSMAVGVNLGQAPRHRVAARALRIAAAANRRRRLVAATTRPVVVRVRRLRVRPELRRQRPGVPRRPVCFPFT